MIRRAVMLAPLVLLAAACHHRGNTGGASPSEARQLDEAAASLDANTIDPNGSDAADNGD
jgi:hypothetical protein